MRSSADASASRPPKNRRKGSDLLEFSLIVIPFMGLIALLCDLSWGIFAQGTLQWAVRTAVHSGVQLSATQMANGACLTDTVKALVQKNSLGLLSGNTGLAKIQVHYFVPPAPSSSGTLTDVSTESDGNTPGNIMQVSVRNYAFLPLMPRFFDGSGSPSDAALGISVYSADMIESSGSGGNIACIGTAP